MTDPANVPPVDDGWIAARRDRLVAEVARAPVARHRLSRRRVVGGFGALAAAGAASIAGVLIAGGPAASNAFAGWSATPTQPAAGELSDAIAQCKTAPATPPAGAVLSQSGNAPARPGTLALADTSNWQLAVSDVRGPFSMLLFTDGDNTSILCVDGPSFQSRSTEIAQQSALADDAISIDRFATSINPAAGAYTFVDGRVGAGVTAASLVLDDGETIAATIQNGRFVAWWPGAHTLKSTQVTTAAGTTTQAASLPQAPAPPASGGSASASSVQCVINGVAASGADCPPPPSGATGGSGVLTVSGGSSGGGAVQEQNTVQVQAQGSSGGG